MKTNSYKGLGIAVITPFTDDNQIDTEKLTQLVDHLITSKVDYLVALGTTAETPTLSVDERQLVLKTIIEATNNRVPVVLGMGGTATKEIIDCLNSWDLTGVSAILSVTPFYNKPSQEGLYQHFEQIALHSPLPVILYTVCSRAACNLEAETTLRLAQLDNIIGIKEASGNINQIMKIIQHKPKDFLVISGDDAITLPLIAAGVDGLISVVGNAFPEQCGNMVRLALDNQFDKARQYHQQLLDITQACFKEGSPAGIKTILAIQNKIEYYLRLPLTRVSIEHQQCLKELCQKLESYTI